jgi:hypothetical protein
MGNKSFCRTPVKIVEPLQNTGLNTYTTDKTLRELLQAGRARLAKTLL